MMIDVVGLLRPVRRPVVEGIEELAARLAAGEVVPPEEAAVVLDRCRCDEAALQAAVDRHGRVLELQREVARAEPIRRKLQEAEGAIAVAEAEVAKARRKLAAVEARYGEELVDWRLRVEAADRARKALVAADNLPPAEAARLASARRAVDDSDTAATAARQAAADAGKRLAEAETARDKAAAVLDTTPDSADWQAEAVRWGNAVKARGEALKAAQEAVRVADASLETARREAAAVEISVARAAGAA